MKKKIASKSKGKIKVELSKTQLRKLFQMIVLFEIVKDNEGKDESNSVFYNNFKKFFTDAEIELLISNSYELLENYVNTEDVEEIDNLLQEERVAMVNIIQEQAKKGQEVSLDDLYNRITQHMSDEDMGAGYLQIFGNLKRYDD